MDWTGTPEECVRVFGSVPAGALLFILEQNRNEPAKYKGDGIGNASHIGIVTQRGDGAIHSSASRGCVATSKFRNKSINGGWNRVGLLKTFEYGKGVDWLLDHEHYEPVPEEKEAVHMQGIVTAPSGKNVNLRKNPATSAPLLDRVPIGADIDVIEYGPDWCKVDANGQQGWMMTEFIQLEGEIVPGGEDPAEPDPDGWVNLKVRYDELAAAYPAIKSICDQIVELIGRG
jgi:hypothetical protein